MDKKIKPHSALKAHCKPGPKSPTRCNSALSAAIPPTFVPYDSAVAFHKALGPRELANPTVRIAVGELALALHSKNTESGVRSIRTLENLCRLSQNEPAVSYLRELAKSFGKSVPSSLHGFLATGNARVSGNARISDEPEVPSAHALPLSQGSAKEDDTVRFSASVQSKLYDTTASPSSLSAGADLKSHGRKRGGDRSRREPSGGSSGKKSKFSKRNVSRVPAHNSQHFSGGSGDVSSLPLEAPGSQDGTPTPIPPVVQLQPNTKNMDKVCRRTKKGTSSIKRSQK